MNIPLLDLKQMFSYFEVGGIVALSYRLYAELRVVQAKASGLESGMEKLVPRVDELEKCQSSHTAILTSLEERMKKLDKLDGLESMLQEIYRGYSKVADAAQLAYNDNGFLKSLNERVNRLEEKQ